MTRAAVLLVAVAGLFGAVGVATAAAGAHMSGDPRLATVSNFLMLHAAALIGAAAVSPALGRLALWPAWAIAIGALLFCGDLLIRVVYGASPVPMTAPAGGVLLIVGWSALALGAVVHAVRR